MTRIGIVSYAQTPFGERPEAHAGELVYQAASGALEAAGLAPAAIDVVVGASCDTIDGRSISNVFMAEAMAAFMKEEAKIEDDGAFALFYAWTRLVAGPNRTALVVAHAKMTESSPHSYTGMMADPFFGRPVGLGGLPAAALQARAWITASGAPARALAEVASKNRTNGAKNPLAHLREAVTVEAVEASPVAASPLRSLEVSPASDGAAAMVIAIEERARELHPRPVWIEGAGYSHDLAYPGHRDLARLKSCREAAERAYKMARVRYPARQTNLAEITECFAHQELMLYEALGFAPPREAVRFLESGATRADGDFPVNPSGGALCGDPGVATGLARVGEVCLQLWRKAGPHQLEPTPTRGIAHAASGLAMQSNIVYVLGTDRE